jgi:hypothetical protein
LVIKNFFYHVRCLVAYLSPENSCTEDEIICLEKKQNVNKVIIWFAYKN